MPPNGPEDSAGQKRRIPCMRSCMYGPARQARHMLAQQLPRGSWQGCHARSPPLCATNHQAGAEPPHRAVVRGATLSAMLVRGMVAATTAGNKLEAGRQRLALASCIKCKAARRAGPRKLGRHGGHKLVRLVKGKRNGRCTVHWGRRRGQAAREPAGRAQAAPAAARGTVACTPCFLGGSCADFGLT